MDKTISALSRYAADLKYEDLSEIAVHETKRRLIDTLGCAIGGYHAEPSRIARAIARCSVGKPSSRILGSQEPSTPEQAAFVNGVMMRYLDYNDFYSPKTTGHPSDSIAAVVAVADAVHADGKSLLTATALSYEPYCNFSEVLPRKLGWDKCIYGVLSSAVASAKLMGLAEPQIAQAISLSITPNLALEQTRHGELSMWKACAAPNAARNGVFAAQLAQHGLTGPDEAIEGSAGLWQKIGPFEWAPFGGRGGPFRVTLTHFKNFPAVLHAQSPVTLALELRNQVNVDDIESITISTYWVADRYQDRTAPGWHPSTRETADHSIPYLVAAALIDGQISNATFTDQRLHDPQIRGVIEKISIVEDAEFSAIYPDGFPCRIEIAKKSGGRKVANTKYFRGHAENPMSDAEVEGKFRKLAEGLIDPRQADAILAKLWRCDEMDDVGEVLELLVIKDQAGKQA